MEIIQLIMEYDCSLTFKFVHNKNYSTYYGVWLYFNVQICS